MLVRCRNASNEVTKWAARIRSNGLEGMPSGYGRDKGEWSYWK